MPGIELKSLQALNHLSLKTTIKDRYNSIPSRNEKKKKPFQNQDHTAKVVGHIARKSGYSSEI